MSTRLLIVDDQASSRELIRSFLTMPGITFHECASGQDAIALVGEVKPHWVTMDIQMPGLNGFETVRAIKEVHPETRVLIVTSFNDPHFRDLARSAGASGFILKENLLALRLILEKGTISPDQAVPVPISLEQPAKPVAKRILVLDDDKEMGTQLKELLTDEHCQIIHANTGRQAIALQRKNPFDLIVMELVLAGKEGFETLAELRRTVPPPKIIATVKSSWMPVDVYSMMARQLGVHETLAKPLSSEKFLEAVRGALNLPPDTTRL
jgi:two-component system, sensor histidine kinase and response regulator